MAKEEKVVPQKDERQVVWDEYVSNYEKSNPVKFAAKQKNGEFDKIPDHFLGIKETKKQANGKVIVTIR